MRYWNFLIIVMLFSSCNGQNINTLKSEKVKFKDLPTEVIHYLKNPNDYHDDNTSLKTHINVWFSVK